MQHVIDSFVIQNFPTSFHITDHSYGDDFLMKINLDYIEKLVNYAAATRKSIKLQKALEMSILDSLIDLISDPLRTIPASNKSSKK